MVYNALDIAHQLIQSSLPKPRSLSSSPKHYLTMTSLKRTRVPPLMAQPFEVINVTTDTDSNTQDGNKPSEQAHG
ncbi:hypothetical protein I4U23_010315 [Adineta vaga]|nr:hypothetical protein I4U23_010315 [Adineta vaga]